MEEGELDPRELLERLHADKRTLVWTPLAPAGNLVTWRQRPMRDEEALEYLHRHWALPDQPDAAVAGRGLRGRLVAVFARLAFRVMGPYLRSERELFAHLVRMNDALARRCDELAEALSERQTADAENDARLAAWLQVHAEESSGPAQEPT